MMLDAPLAPDLEADADDRTGQPAQTPPQDHRRRRASGDALGQRPQALPAGALARAPGDLRLAAQARHELRALPEVGAAGLPARRLAGRRRRPGLQPRPDPLAVPRRLRHRVRHPGAARRCRDRASSTAISRPRSRRPSTTGSATPSPGPSRACRSAIVVPTENAEAAVAEIERCADDPAFAQVFMLTRTAEPARQPPLLADLRGGRAARLARRPARVRLRRPSPTPAPAGPPTTSRKARGIRPRARRR